MQFFWTIVVLVVLMGISWRYLGSYMAAVFEGASTGSDGWSARSTGPRHEPRARAELETIRGSLIVFSAVSLLITYLIMRIQARFPSTRSTSGPLHLPCHGIQQFPSSRTRTGRTMPARPRCRISPRWPRSRFSSS